MKKILVYLVSLVLLASCVDEVEHDNTPTGNFEALWEIMDEHYCFFSYKQIDWQAVYNKYKVRVSDKMSENQLFEVCCDMLSELRDGHVNLSYSMDYGRYWAWQEGYPKNFSDTLERRYLGTDYKIASSLRYRVLDDNIGYIRYDSFQKAIGEGNLDDVLVYLALCRGLIIDIRNNGGGDLTTAEMLAGRFVHEKTLVGYMQHKTGTGHNDFSDLEPQYLEPSSNFRWHKPVCVLTNRSVYSAANSFTVMMRALPNVTIVGDHTGGGSGMPMSNSLPNGWSVRYSACPMYDKDKQQTEFGISPDVHVALSDESTAKGIDDIIEAARKIIAQK
ncbi:MAG: S41 family peptidase [Prevotella sp.]|nr:S41 family peptidase [Prevotella sp.]MBR1411834.1 S41 family peptidase [Prevotella sp.]